MIVKEIRTSFAKKSYIFCDFPGGGVSELIASIALEHRFCPAKIVGNSSQPLKVDELFNKTTYFGWGALCCFCGYNFKLIVL